MKIVFFILISFATYCLSIDQSLDKDWEKYKKDHKKKYSNEQEEANRRNIWEERHKQIEEHNKEEESGIHSYRQHHNHLSDMTPQEYNHLMGKKHKNVTMKKFLKKLPKTAAKLPTSVDWVKKGYVTRVRAQQDCGSCWAHAAVAALEGQLFKTTRKLVELSEQNFLECTGPNADASTNNIQNDCTGGLVSDAFIYAQNGIDTEKNYPYVSGISMKLGKCRNVKNFAAETIDPYYGGILNGGTESQLQKLVATVGPIAVSLYAGLTSFSTYKSGIYYDPKCGNKETKNNHYVTLVGYGSDGPGKDYWVIKNSWDTDWGIAGYAKLARNKNNWCGIAYEQVYPIL